MPTVSPQQTGKGRTGRALYRSIAPPPSGPMAPNLDARAAQLVRAASDADPFGVDPRAAQLIRAASDADPFGVDPRQAHFQVSTS